MTTAPRCSVIMPAYNVEDFIGEAIESVLRQTVSDWELIVVDDGSTDGTAMIVKRYQDARIRYIYQENAGQSAAQNRGINEIRGAYVSFLDSDDRLQPTAIERLSKALDSAPKACVAYGNAEKIRVTGEAFGKSARPIFNPRPSGDVLHYLVRSNFIVNGGTLLVRVSCINDSGKFRTDLRMQQDWEMWCRLAVVGEFIFVGHEPVSDYRIRDGSVARIDGSSISSHWPAVEAVFTNPKIIQKFTLRELKRLRRVRESDVYYFTGVEAIRGHHWRQARQCLTKSLHLNRVNPKAIILLVCAIMRRTPRFVARRIGC
ncbi:MAG: glycosyltransferase [Pedobacter sp.]